MGSRRQRLGRPKGAHPPVEVVVERGVEPDHHRWAEDPDGGPGRDRRSQLGGGRREVAARSAVRSQGDRLDRPTADRRDQQEPGDGVPWRAEHDLGGEPERRRGDAGQNDPSADRLQRSDDGYGEGSSSERRGQRRRRPEGRAGRCLETIERERGDQRRRSGQRQEVAVLKGRHGDERERAEGQKRQGAGEQAMVGHAAEAESSLQSTEPDQTPGQEHRPHQERLESRAPDGGPAPLETPHAGLTDRLREDRIAAAAPRQPEVAADEQTEDADAQEVSRLPEPPRPGRDDRGGQEPGTEGHQRGDPLGQERRRQCEVADDPYGGRCALVSTRQVVDGAEDRDAHRGRKYRVVLGEAQLLDVEHTADRRDAGQEADERPGQPTDEQQRGQAHDHAGESRG